MKTQFTIGVFGIIFDSQKRVLLCHRRDYDLWNLPGGGVESGESPWNTVVREIKEETGLDVAIAKLVGVYGKTHKDEIVFSFLCTIVNGELILNDEADKIEYFEFEKLPKNIVPKNIERIRDALEGKQEVVLKIQTGKSVLELIKEEKL